MNGYWGPYREPKVYRLPGGEVYCTFSLGVDAYCDQGKPSPIYVSGDGGHTWLRSTWPHPGMTGLAPTITPVNDGEYYCLPSNTGIKLDLTRMPKPAGEFGGYNGYPLFLLQDCPEDVVRWYTDFRAVRWSPRTKLWTEETVQWGDHGDQLIFHEHHDGAWGQKIFLEGSVVRCGGELLYPDYWTQYEAPTGQVPHGWECTLMVSTDNGRSWARRSTIAKMSEGDATGEPGLELNRAGELVCVMRRDFGTAKPMYLAHSGDRGYSWTPPQKLSEFGVLPRLLQLENGVMVLSFGRPGVWLSFSLDGGHSWTEPQAVIAGDFANTMEHTCGYTSLLALGNDSFLLAYSDFLLPNARGEPCKSILVRRVSVEPAMGDPIPLGTGAERN